jgi:hypothetical protein
MEISQEHFPGDPLGHFLWIVLFFPDLLRGASSPTARFRLGQTQLRPQFYSARKRAGVVHNIHFIFPLTLKFKILIFLLKLKY